MTKFNSRVAATALLSVVLGATASAQSPSPNKAGKATPSAPPATKLEAFSPEAGSVVTFGYDNLGQVLGVSVDVRQLRDSRGATVSGLLVEVTESEYRKEQSFVDADEIPELLKGFDALLRATANPTEFSNFEVQYKTRGGLQLTAFNTHKNKILYAVKAGRISTAQYIGLADTDMQKLRSLFESALAKLKSLNSSK
jgi:hypothetical protein